MKYKLLKNTPAHKAGLICQEGLRDGANMQILYPVGSCNRICMVEDITDEWFAPFLCQTVDGIDLYKGDWYVPLVHGSIWDKQQACGIGGYDNNENTKFFSTKEAAEKYIQEQNNPKFVENEWLFYKCGEEEFIFRYNGKKDDGSWLTTEAYGKEMYGTIKCINNIIPMFFRNRWANDKITKASVKQITSILSMVAISKGFKEGVKFYPHKECDPHNLNWLGSVIGNFTYDSYNGSEYLGTERGMGRIYMNGKWAEILPQEVSEYKIPYISTRVDENQAVLTLHNGTFTSVTLENKQVKINYQVK